jgi:hypothetical protein
VPALTESEKEQGRIFRGAAAAALVRLNYDDPPDFKPLPVSGLFRHNCAGRKGVSTALRLYEVYMVSSTPIPAQAFHDVHQAQALMGVAHPDVCVDGWLGDDGRFGFRYREGKCKGCNQAARSSTGIFVDVLDRPPLPTSSVR